MAEGQEAQRGNAVTYEIGPQPPNDDPDMDLCAWCLTRADHVAAGDECYERNSARNRIARAQLRHPEAEDEVMTSTTTATLTHADRAWSLIWCPTCQTVRRMLMTADGHEGADILCDECHVIIATFHA